MLAAQRPSSRPRRTPFVAVFTSCEDCHFGLNGFIHGRDDYSIASRIPPGRFIWVVCLVGCRVVVFAFVRMFVRSWRLLAPILGASLGASWVPFWELGGSPGHHFRVSGHLLGSILGVWGLPWASFLGLWGSSGAFGALWGPPWPPKVPKAKFSHFFPSHFGLILAPFWR